MWGHRSCGFASAPPYSGLQDSEGLSNPIHHSEYPNARDGSTDTKDGWCESKDMSHIGMVGYIAEHALRHPDVAIEDASDTSTWASLQLSFRQGVESTYLMMSMPSVRDKPKAKLDTLRPRRPSKMTGLRPITSDNQLHRHVVSACATKKSDSCEKNEYGSTSVTVCAPTMRPE
jgi:hypothetical protein